MAYLDRSAPAYINMDNITEPVAQPIVRMVPAMTDPPENHMVAAIVAIFCFCPLGIYALVKANEVDKAVMKGDRPGAVVASERAHRLVCWALAIGSVIIVVHIVGITGHVA